jgi:hypothetical protein
LGGALSMGLSIFKFSSFNSSTFFSISRTFKPDSKNWVQFHVQSGHIQQC